MPKDDSVISFLQKSPSKGYKTHDVDPLGPHSASLRGSHCPDRPRSPSHDRPRTRDAYSGHHRLSSRSYECYEERVAYSDAPAHRRRPRSRESPPSRHLDFSCRSPSPHHSSSRERFAAGGSSSPERMRFASNGPYQRRSTSRWSPSPPQERFASRRSPSPTQRRVASRRSPSPTQRRVASRQSPSPTQRRVASRRSPSPTQRRVASKGSPPPKRMGFAPVAGPSSSRRPLSWDSRSPRRSSRDFLSLQRGSPSSKRRRYEARDSVSHQQLHSSRASSQEPSQELYRSLHAGSSHHDSRRYLRFVEERTY